MKHMHCLLAATLVAGVSAASTASLAAAPAELDSTQTLPYEYKLETVLIVHNWILCLSQPTAQRMAAARELGPTEEAVTYADLAAQKVCGRFAKLGVLLHQSLYRTAPGHGLDTRVFSAAVNLGVGWQDAFVVSGDQPQE